MLTVFIVEDHGLVSEGIQLLLKDRAELKVIGHAGDGRKALQEIREKKPDIVLLDLFLPTLPGLEILAQVKDETAVIIVSARGDDLYVAEALAGGAKGYVLKDSTSSELLDAIRYVAAGKRYLSTSINEDTVNQLLFRLKGKGSEDPFQALTKREHTILQMSAEGLTSAEIAARLFISSRTVETHRANIMRKLNFRSQSDLVRFAVRKGLITP